MRRLVGVGLLLCGGRDKRYREERRTRRKGGEITSVGCKYCVDEVEGEDNKGEGKCEGEGRMTKKQGEMDRLIHFVPSPFHSSPSRHSQSVVCALSFSTSSSTHSQTNTHKGREGKCIHVHTFFIFQPLGVRRVLLTDKSIALLLLLIHRVKYVSFLL